MGCNTCACLFKIVPNYWKSTKYELHWIETLPIPRKQERVQNGVFHDAYHGLRDHFQKMQAAYTCFQQCRLSSKTRHCYLGFINRVMAKWRNGKPLLRTLPYPVFFQAKVNPRSLCLVQYLPRKPVLDSLVRAKSWQVPEFAALPALCRATWVPTALKGSAGPCR